MNILSVKNLHKSFGGLYAVIELSFGISEGEILGLIGPNGAGETTLFNCITGFLVPEKGEIEFESEDLVGLSTFQICKKGVARTFQIERRLGAIPSVYQPHNQRERTGGQQGFLDPGR